MEFWNFLSKNIVKLKGETKFHEFFVFVKCFEKQQKSATLNFRAKIVVLDLRSNEHACSANKL